MKINSHTKEIRTARYEQSFDFYLESTTVVMLFAGKVICLV